MATGSISWTKFKKDALEIIRHSGRIHDGWQFTTIQLGKEEPGFLQKKNVQRLLKTIQTQNSAHTSNKTVAMATVNEEQDSWEKDLEEDYSSVDSHSKSASWCIYEYHVVYSLSYGVPVLYFNASKEDGRLLSLEEVWNNVNENYQSSVVLDRWSFITQQEHPLLCRPFYQIHPCHTADMMKATGIDWNQTECNYLVTWLSSLGPVVGLQLDLSYGTLDTG
ncbi:ubiquitin-like-conjugating enzyme ATG10 [Ptychodera flava]|uniref:ubiquitin-like-conjugating enzyme ATG10 n=1 Tax=Ptychodera flava TaxID=63121 RepID=UPI00396A6188